MSCRVSFLALADRAATRREVCMQELGREPGRSIFASGDSTWAQLRAVTPFTCAGNRSSEPLGLDPRARSPVSLRRKHAAPRPRLAAGPTSSPRPRRGGEGLGRGGSGPAPPGGHVAAPAAGGGECGDGCGRGQSGGGCGRGGLRGEWAALRCVARMCVWGGGRFAQPERSWAAGRRVGGCRSVRSFIRSFSY